MFELHVFNSRVERNGVERFVVPHAWSFELEVIEEIEFGS